MLPYFTEQFGNPASRQHAWGWEAQDAVDAARAQVAALINASAGGDRLHQRRHANRTTSRIKGDRPRALRDRGDHVITVATEHKSVLDSCKRLETRGLRRHACSASAATA